MNPIVVDYLKEMPRWQTGEWVINFIPPTEYVGGGAITPEEIRRRYAGGPTQIVSRVRGCERTVQKAENDGLLFDWVK